MPTDSGQDHCANFMPVMESIACGYYKAVEDSFPHTINLATNGYPLYIHGSNLLMAIWYQDANIVEKIEPKITKYLNGKGNK